ncbi:Fatty acid metabolism regulator protein [compost metagenome]
MRPRDDNKVEAIIEATIQLVNEIGFSETSVSKIAKRAGVSAATIYIYFENKEDMLSKIYVQAKQKMSDRVFRGVDPTAPIRKRFDTFLTNFVEFIISNKDEYLFMEQVSNSPLLRNWCLEETQELYAPVYEIFEEGKGQNLFKPVDLPLLVVYAIVPLAQLAKEQFKDLFQFDDEKLRIALDMSWDAIKR